MDHTFKCKTINILEETIRENLYKVRLGKKKKKKFDRTPKAQSIKKTLDFIKMKNDCSVKVTIKRMKKTNH